MQARRLRSQEDPIRALPPRELALSGGDAGAPASVPIASSGRGASRTCRPRRRRRAGTNSPASTARRAGAEAGAPGGRRSPVTGLAPTARHAGAVAGAPGFGGRRRRRLPFAVASSGRGAPRTCGRERYALGPPVPLSTTRTARTPALSRRDPCRRDPARRSRARAPPAAVPGRRGG